jgi:hypothetical protein
VDPKAVFPGEVTKISLLAGPATVKLLVRPVVRPGDVAFRVNDPAVPSVILQPEKVATVAVRGFVVQLNVPEPVLIASVTVAAEAATLPCASSTVTTGWELKTVPPVLLVGDVVTISWLGAPGAMLNAPVVAELSDPSLAVRV